MGRARGKSATSQGRRTGRPTGRPKEWTDERIRYELAEFLDGRSEWPTVEEFKAAGRRPLSRAAAEGRGVEYWAREFGVEVRPKQYKRQLTDLEALAEARAVVSAVGYLPGNDKLLALGRERLASYLQRRGGSYEFARRHGLPARPYVRKASRGRE